MVQRLRSDRVQRFLQLLCVWMGAVAAAGAAADAPGPVPEPPVCPAGPPRPPGRPPALTAPKPTPLVMQNFVYCSAAPMPGAPASATAPPAPGPASAPPPACPAPAPAEKCTVDPATVPTSVEINFGKGIGLKFQSAGWLAWVLTGLCVVAVIAALVQVLRSGPPTPTAGGAAPARGWGWGWLAALLALVLGLCAGLALAPGPQLSEAQLRELQASPQFKAAMVELVEAKAEAARLRERVAALELAARTGVPVAPAPVPAPAEPRTGGYDLFSLVLGAALAVAVGLAWFTRWVQDHAQMRAVLQAIGAAVSAAGVGRTASEPVPPSAESIALATVRRLLAGRWRVAGDSP